MQSNIGLRSISSEELGLGTQSGLDALFASARHPVACMFHVGFKVLSVAAFLFLNAFIGEDILTFVVVVLFAAFDFWTVKNVTGRLLVNLRWHSEIDDYGNERYVYESDMSTKHEESQAIAGDLDAQESLRKRKAREEHRTDRWVFWSGLYGAPVVWTALFIIQMMSLRLFWGMTSGVCLSFSFTNAQGYYNCQQD